MKTYKLPSKTTTADAVILANGSFPIHEIPLSILKNSKQLICCDGAIDRLTDRSIIPQAIIGDCDSISENNRIKFRSIIHQVDDQETNDLTKAVHFCLKKSLFNIVILGSTGYREDHTIANIGLLADYIELTNNISIISDYGIFNAIKQPASFDSYPKQQVSLFSIIPSEITISNLKYPIQKRVLTNWWQASLNEALSTTFDVYTDNKTIIYRTF